MIVLGLMSGTSLDGVDAAIVDVRPRGPGYDVTLRSFRTVPFAAAFRARLLAALPPNEPSVREAVELDAAFSDVLARAAVLATNGEHVDLVASHGLTLYHRGEAAQTLQIGAPYALRDAVGATVVYDFRRADCAAGGHGAPLVPHFDALVFGHAEHDVVALNLGGIANVSIVPKETYAVRAAWDTGPANVLIDTFVTQRTGEEKLYDTDGAFAERGAVDAAALRELCLGAQSYFDAAPPKTTGRETFGPQFVHAHGAALASLSLEDGCATLAAFTVEGIVRSLAAFGPAQATLIASGGGVHNAAIMAGLRRRLTPRGWEIVSSHAAGVDPDAKEALAFALFAYETLRGRPANVPAATGARGPAVLGSIVPHALDAVLAKMHAELAANGSA